MSGISNAVSGLTDLATSFIDVDENSSFQQQQMVGDMLMKSGNPYAMAAGAAFKGLSAMDQALGINVNTINKKEAEFADISKGERVLNNVLGFLPGTGAGLLAGKTADFNYDEVPSLRIEARQKLKQVRPENVGQASRISGVSPADVSVLLVYLGR